MNRQVGPAGSSRGLATGAERLIRLKGSLPGAEEMVMMANPLTERRLFVRRAVDGVEVDWNIDHNRRRSRWGARRTPRVRVLDISAGGLCVLAPRDDHLVRGTPVVIGEELMTGLVAVRWSLPADERGLARFGVEYIELSYELEAYLMEPLSDRESPFVEVGWTP